MARLRDLPPGRRVVTRSGFPGTVVGVARLGDLSLVLVDLDLLQGQTRNPVMVFPEHLTPAAAEPAVSGDPGRQAAGG